MMLIDTHAHINFQEYKDDGDQVIQRALKNNIWMINVGAEFKTSKRAVEYAEKYSSGVYAAVGLHPFHLENQIIKESIKGEEVEIVSKKEKFDFKKYYLLAKFQKVVAIGEIGLDYKNLSQKRNSEKIKDKQKKVLYDQINLALQLELPIIFHCRQAYNDLLFVLKKFNAGCNNCPFGCRRRVRGVIHSFMGRWSQAEEFLKMGLFLSFNGVITYARDYDKVIRNTPLENILLETDCPYLTPVPFRGKRNEPLYVKYVAQKIAEIKEISLEKVAEQTTQNAQNLFNL